MAEVERIPSTPGIGRFLRKAIGDLGLPADLSMAEATLLHLQGKLSHRAVYAVMAIKLADGIDLTADDARADTVREVAPQLIDILRQLGGAAEDPAAWEQSEQGRAEVSEILERARLDAAEPGRADT